MWTDQPKKHPVSMTTRRMHSDFFRVKVESLEMVLHLILEEMEVYFLFLF